MKIKILLLLAILTITGCGAKDKLTCTKKEKNAGYDYQETYELLYDNDGVNKINLSVKATFNEQYTDDEINEQFEYLTNYCGLFDMADEKLITCKTKRNDNVVTVDAVIDVEKINDDKFEAFMYVTKDEISNYKDTKKMLENVGYKCK